MLVKVKIKNFLSIKDEETIKINNGITSIIGKNESGKSTILKAIKKLNGEQITKKEKNSNLKNEPSEIQGTFRITKAQVKEINKEYSENSTYSFYKLPEKYEFLYFTITITDENSIRYFSMYYLDDNNTLTKINSNIYIDGILEELKKYYKKIKTNLTDEHNKMFDNLLNLKGEDEIKNYIKDTIISSSIADNIKDELNSIASEIIENHWIDLLPSYKFIYFNSFKDVLSDSININDVSNNVQAQNILKIGNIDTKELKIAIEERDEVFLSNIESQYIDVVTNKFKEIFQQTDDDFKLKLRISTGKNEIFFLTNDKTSKNCAINISERSDGFRWYLSIYLTLFDYIEEDIYGINHILLIDEPNLYLHARAQSDLLHRIFKNEFKNMQIIYTTHSPYMIDGENSFSIRIIEKDIQTHIYNDTRSYAMKKQGGKDVDVITPLLTSLELNFSNNLVINEKCKTIIVEGIQDVYVLSAFIKKLKKTKEFANIKFIPCYGSEKVPFMFGYLFGLGYSVYALVDNDKAGRKTISIIKESDVENPIREQLITYFSKKTYEKNSDCLLEDLFSVTDKQKYLPTKSTINYKDIYDNYDKYSFDNETVLNFNNLLDKLSSAT